MPYSLKRYPSKRSTKSRRQPRTSEHLGTAERFFRDMKKIAKFKEDHPKLFNGVAIGLAGIGLFAALRKQNG